jgi:serine protease AprX
VTRAVRALRLVPVAGLLALGSGLAAFGQVDAVAQKVDPRVLEDTQDGRTGHFLVALGGQAVVRTAVKGAADRAAQGRLAMSVLRQAASEQTGARAELARLDARVVRPYWIVDALAVEGTRAAVEAMAARSDVEAIEPDRAFRALPQEEIRTVSAAPAGVEWNVEKIGAPGVWRLGDHGENVVYGSIDSGVQWDHPALKSHYRGWDGSTATHDYNWWDAVHGDIDGDGANPCGFNVKAPCDDSGVQFNSHGTHTMGTAVGDDGAGNQIGIAPGAKWISCRPMDVGTGRPSSYLECLQFFLAPTNLNGGNPDPSRRPDVVGNSWACPPEEGCAVGVLQAAFENLRAAGVFMAVAAGNEGRNGCSTVVYPPGPYDSAISVGAVDQLDRIAVFSSRGPVTVDGSGRRKPDLVAPGVGVRSSIAAGYGTSSGTSMATPHLGGAVALLWSAFPSLRRNVDRTEQILEQSAVPLVSAATCGGDSPTQVPNNVFGYGRIDVLAAYRMAEAEFPPELAVADASVREGNRGTTKVELTVTLSRGSTQAVTVRYATANRTAKAGSDYAKASGSLELASGETKKTITLSVTGDAVAERDETFAVTLSEPAHATLGRGQSVVTIANDDAPDRVAPSLSRLGLVPTRFGVSAGALVRFRLSEAATTTFTVERDGAGAARRVRRFSLAGRAGQNAFRLAAHVPTRLLTPASYRLTAVPKDAAGNVGRPVRAGFTVLP